MRLIIAVIILVVGLLTAALKPHILFANLRHEHRPHRGVMLHTQEFPATEEALAPYAFGRDTVFVKGTAAFSWSQLQAQASNDSVATITDPIDRERIVVYRIAPAQVGITSYNDVWSKTRDLMRRNGFSILYPGKTD